MSTDRPAPPITVSIPGRGEAPAELLAVGPAPSRRPALPVRERATAWGAGLVLSAGVAFAATYEEPPAPQPPRAVPVAPPVSASVVSLDGERFLERFGLLVRPAVRLARGDSGSPSVEEQVQVLALTARGFEVRLGTATPAALARGGVPTGFDVEVRVVDCSVDTQAPRRLELQVLQAGGRPLTVRVDAGPEVVRALDRLVSRTCRRPRG